VIDLRCPHHKHNSVEIPVGAEVHDLDLRIVAKCRWCERSRKGPVYHIWTWQELQRVIRERGRGRTKGLVAWSLADQEAA
jgi:hypothetical protein